MNIQLLQQIAINRDCSFEVISPLENNYNQSRQIINARFDHYPIAIAYCETANDVACCIDFCNKTNTPIRVRSGGHNHEGMSSADNVLIIDLSKFNSIQYIDKKTKKEAWIGVGCHLGKVYKELGYDNRIIPGGGCGSVCIGGLTQGGGWGFSARKLGLTCNTILAAEIVLANGEVVTANPNNEYADLLWGLKGGGGGNFGIVTRFLFQLYTITEEKPMNYFILQWERQHMLALTQKWLELAPHFDDNLTTAFRLDVSDEADTTATPVLLVGIYYGQKGQLQSMLQPFYDIATPSHTRGVKADSSIPKSPQEEDTHPHLLVGSLLQLPQFKQTAPKGKLNIPGFEAFNRINTCNDMSIAHKVSSSFYSKTNDQDDHDLAKVITNYIETSSPSKGANAFITLHALGGKIKTLSPEQQSFPYTSKDIILQYQNWWLEESMLSKEEHDAWISSYRQATKPWIEGAFINFPDIDLVEKLDSVEDKLQLLKHYYAQNLPRLRQIKTKYDPLDFFSFKMSIPIL